MPFDGAGKFYRVHNWEEDRQNDLNIVSDRHDEEDDNFADGLSQCLLKNGVVSMTGDLKMGSFQIKNLANGTATNDAINKSQLDALDTTLRNLITTNINNTLSSLYPVGSVYIGTQSTCPLASLISGSTWQLVATDRALWGGNGSNGNSTINAGLPNITGWFASGCLMNWQDSQYGGALYRGTQSSYPQNAGGTDGGTQNTIAFDASRSNGIYGASSTVQPPAYRVNVWRRTA